MSGITDRLIEAAHSVELAYLDNIRTIHRHTAEALEMLKMVEAQLDNCWNA